MRPCEAPARPPELCLMPHGTPRNSTQGSTSSPAARHKGLKGTTLAHPEHGVTCFLYLGCFSLF